MKGLKWVTLAVWMIGALAVSGCGKQKGAESPLPIPDTAQLSVK